ncbi:MAG: hypothetical protein RL572_1619 [Pseudomonadota bacterium]|jgi:hypothetical protein
MFGKFLLTFIILLLGLLWIRQVRQQRLRDAAGSGPALPQSAAPALNDYRFAAWLFLALMLGLGGYLYYLQWQQDNTVLQVVLHREGNSAPISYEVRRSELDERAFTTVQGVRVTVAASERMEVLGLQDAP